MAKADAAPEAPLSRKAAIAELETELLKQALNGGMMTVRYRCEHCARDGSKTIERFDSDAQRHLLKLLTDLEKASGGGLDAGAGAAEILARRSELTDDQLAGEIARLRAMVSA